MNDAMLSAAPDQAIFRGESEMARRCRAFDWAATPLGPAGAWPHSLRTVAALVLGSGFPSIVVWGPELVQIYNDAYIPLIGTRHPAALGAPTHATWPEIRHIQEPIFARVFRGETVDVREAHYPLRRNDGVEDLYFDATFIPVPRDDGRIGGSLSTLFDVTGRVTARALETERAALVEVAEKARLEAETANRAKAEFLAVMSHELRTPLNAIGGYVELIDLGIHGPVTDAQHEDLHRIQVSQRNLLGLINEVLNYARLEAGRVRYEIAEVRVREVLAAAEQLVAPQARGLGLELAIEHCPGKVAVMADAEKTRQIVVNLLSNAMKFTPAGGRITLACDARGDRACIAVRDTGIGIAAAKLESIFEPFVQVRSDLARTAEGTGLGLAISRDLARGMGGDLTVESTPGEGSTFSLDLPRAPAA